MAITISENTTWSGQIDLVENVILENGATLTIARGSTLTGVELPKGFGMVRGPSIEGSGQVVFDGYASDRITASNISFETRAPVSISFTDFTNVGFNIIPSSRSTAVMGNLVEVEVSDSTFTGGALSAGAETFNYEGIFGANMVVSNTTFNSSNLSNLGLIRVENSDFSETNVDIINLGGGDSELQGNRFSDSTIFIVNREGGSLNVIGNSFNGTDSYFPGPPAMIDVTAAHDGVLINENNFFGNEVAIDFGITIDSFDYGGTVNADNNWFGSNDASVIAERVISSDDLYIYGDVILDSWLTGPKGTSPAQSPSAESPSGSVVEGQGLEVGVYQLDIIVDLFGSLMYLPDLNESVTDASHIIEYNENSYDYSEVDGFITTVKRNGEFTEEFAAEIAESFPSSAGISYETALDFIGQANMESTLLMVAGADGNYVG